MTSDLWTVLIIIGLIAITGFCLVMIGRKQERTRMDQESKDAMMKVLKSVEPIEDELSKLSDEELDKRI